jgi:hypothetical protein
MYEHSFSLLTRSQLWERQHRIGQTKTVTIEQLIMQTSLDEYAVGIVDAKEDATKNDTKGAVMLHRQTLLTALKKW